jgi:hypothetical protein
MSTQSKKNTKNTKQDKYTLATKECSRISSDCRNIYFTEDQYGFEGLDAKNISCKNSQQLYNNAIYGWESPSPMELLKRLREGCKDENLTFNQLIWILQNLIYMVKIPEMQLSNNKRHEKNFNDNFLKVVSLDEFRKGFINKLNGTDYVLTPSFFKQKRGSLVINLGNGINAHVYGVRRQVNYFPNTDKYNNWVFNDEEDIIRQGIRYGFYVKFWDTWEGKYLCDIGKKPYKIDYFDPIKKEDRRPRVSMRQFWGYGKNEINPSWIYKDLKPSTSSYYVPEQDLHSTDFAYITCQYDKHWFRTSEDELCPNDSMELFNKLQREKITKDTTHLIYQYTLDDKVDGSVFDIYKTIKDNKNDDKVPECIKCNIYRGINEQGLIPKRFIPDYTTGNEAKDKKLFNQKMITLKF